MGRVTPRCSIGKIEKYVSAQGTYHPCCWVGNAPFTNSLRAFLGEQLWSELDTTKHNIAEIENSSALHKLKDSWEHGTFEPCVYFCGKPIADRNSALDRDRRDINLAVNLDTGEIKYL